MTTTASMPPVQFAQVNGIRMAYYEAGPKEGHPLILCHGFPEIAYSWRLQIESFAKAGYHVIAPDQRGYGQTEAPPRTEDYDMEHLAGDLIALLDHLGIRKAVFVGHDWGGLISWQLPLMYPERISGHIGVNTPYQPRRKEDPIAFMEKTLGEHMYIVFFQKPGLPEAILEEDIERTIRFFSRLPPPKKEGEGERAIGPYSFALHMGVQNFKPAGDRRQMLSDEEVAVYVEAFTRSGFRGPVNWYRNMTRNWEKSAHLPVNITIPCLMVMAERDAVLMPSLTKGMERFIPDLEKVLIEDCGHWTQREKPEELNRIILDWLERRKSVLWS